MMQFRHPSSVHGEHRGLPKRGKEVPFDSPRDIALVFGLQRDSTCFWSQSRASSSTVGPFSLIAGIGFSLALIREVIKAARRPAVTRFPALPLAPGLGHAELAPGRVHQYVETP